MLFKKDETKKLIKDNERYGFKRERSMRYSTKKIWRRIQTSTRGMLLGERLPNLGGRYPVAPRKATTDTRSIVSPPS